MKPPTQTDISLIRRVNAHVKTLSALSVHDADEASLAVASGSLRFLLVEDWLGQAWKASGLGGPMTFKAWCITSTHGNDVVAYCGGGDLLPGVPFSACHNAKLAELPLDLAAFRQKPRIQIGTVKVSTVQLIQYVANTLPVDPTSIRTANRQSPASRCSIFSAELRLANSLVLSLR